jgi:GDSL-like Lipase/Acylhydrolase family
VSPTLTNIRLLAAVGICLLAVVAGAPPAHAVKPLIGRWDGTAPGGGRVSFLVLGDVLGRRYVTSPEFYCAGGGERGSSASVSGSDTDRSPSAFGPVARNGRVPRRMTRRREGGGSLPVTPPIQGRLGRRSGLVTAEGFGSSICPEAFDGRFRASWQPASGVQSGRWRLTNPDGFADATFDVEGNATLGNFVGFFRTLSLPGPYGVPIPCALSSGLFGLDGVVIVQDGWIEPGGSFATPPYPGMASVSGRFDSASTATGAYTTRYDNPLYCIDGPSFGWSATLVEPQPPPVVVGTQLALVPYSPRPIVYLALGDSYCSGEGVGQYLPGSEQRGGCHRSRRAYAQLFSLPGFEFDRRFYACSGAVTDDVLVRAQKDEPAPQLERLPPDQLALVNLVTITIGGNDAGFADVLLECTLHQCDRGERRRRILARVDEEVPPKVANTYRAIRERVPNATLVVLGYPRLFPARGRDEPRCFAHKLPRARQLFLNEVGEHLNDRLREQTRAAGVHYVDVHRLFAGHEPCGRKKDWIFGLSKGLDNPPISLQSYHPNREGQAGYATALRLYLGCMIARRWPLGAGQLPRNPDPGQRTPEPCVPR